MKNRGELPQYYVHGGHPPIIDPSVFDHVQEHVERASKEPSQGLLPLAMKLRCGVCGKRLIRKVHHTGHAHYEKAVLKCPKTPNVKHCNNIQLLDEKLAHYLSELVFVYLKEHPEVIALCKKAWKAVVQGKKAPCFTKLAPVEMTEKEELCLITEQIAIYPDHRLVLKLQGGASASIKIPAPNPTKPRKAIGSLPPKTVRCTICGKEMVVSGRSDQKYCSRECYYESLKARLRGEKK